MKRRIALLVVLGAALVSVPAAAGGAAASSAVAPITRLLCGCDMASAARTTAAVVSGKMTTFSMSIVHVFRGCHVWTLGSKELGPTATVTARAGSRMRLRMSCPMDFDLKQVGGPKLAFGSPRFQAGTTRVVTFRKPGTYRFVARNVQTSDEIGLETLGEDNLLRLTIRVR